MPKILVVDDEPDILEVLEMALHGADTQVLTARSARDALAILRQESVDVAVSDIRMPDLSGVDLLQQAASVSPGTAFVMMTAYADTETAIDALQYGARDYLIKPFKMSELAGVVRRVLEERRCHTPDAPYKHEAEAQQGRILFQALSRSRIIGKSPGMIEIYRTIAAVAPNDSTVLVTGESGTGKELVARAIHEASPRKDGPFVSVNCGAFPETLLESELFGYVKGAFTGASGSKQGLIEAAAGGSLFLDEVTEMTPVMQVKVLRVLQERKLRRLGSTAETEVDVRVVAATNRDPVEAMRSGLLREDLYYRLAVIVLRLPALRERREDVEPLASHFLRLYSERGGKSIRGFSAGALETLQAYDWPGNVRELQSTVERAVAMETDTVIHTERLPETIRRREGGPQPGTARLPTGPFHLEEYLAGLERDLICRALEECDGNQTLAAERLGVTKPSLRHKISSLGIDVSRFRA